MDKRERTQRGSEVLDWGGNWWMVDNGQLG